MTNAEFIALAALVIGLAELMVAFLIARSINKLTLSQSRLQTQHQINQQWQSFNISAVQDKSVRNSLLGIGYEDGGEEFIQKRYITFYILNILSDVYTSWKQGLIEDEFAIRMARDQANLLSKNRDILDQILLGNRGYAQSFIDFIYSQFQSTDGERTKVPSSDEA